jgi:peptidoglycan/LPS O-acetylase OafA/YrhL
MAIISVVIFHFGSFLPLGYIGVDLFFVISGLLIGNLLTTEFQNGNKINFLKFILQRGLKIWPSFYFFLFIGSIISYLLYRDTNPDQIIPLNDMKRYLFFYQNYTGIPFHFSFDHVWSLCVEEHFYILLPLLFIKIQFFSKIDNGGRYLFICMVLAIVAGIGFKYASFYLTNSKDTYSATHNRIDALAWGVLLNLILKYKRDWIPPQRKLYWFSIIGTVLFVLILLLKVYWANDIFQRIWFHSLLPCIFFLIIFGVYFVDFSGLKWLRIISYYSYNWYLWHPLFAIFIAQSIGENILGLIIYLMLTFIVAVTTTTFIEEPMLTYRSILISKWFGNLKPNSVG